MEWDELHKKASDRVAKSPRLSKYSDVILYDRSPIEEHLRWVISAKVSEIEAWAAQVKGGYFGHLKTF